MKSRFYSLKSVVDNAFKAIVLEQISDKTSSEVIADVRMTFKPNPIAEIVLAFLRHLIHITIKRVLNQFNVFVASFLPPVSILMEILGVPDDFLLENHCYAFRKQLPKELFSH